MQNQEKIIWSELNDAYGKAIEIPKLLHGVMNDKNNSDALWFELWSRLCHQGSIYDASYAAVPCIVNAIPNEKTSININFFLLPISIEISRHQNNNPEIPESLKDIYTKSLEQIDYLADVYESKNNSNLFKKVLKATHLVVSRNINEAENILDE
jgi:hypothetical protein